MSLARLLLLCPLLLCAAVAEDVPADEPIELPDIELTVSRYRQPKEDVAAQVVVLDRRDLEASGGDTVKDILLSVPGIDVRPQGAAGAQAGVSIRGSRTEQVLVIIDGRRVNTAQGGGVDFADIALSDIERIEILKGGGSVLYGSDPVGGVINIITKRGGEGDIKLTTEAGSFGTWSLLGSTGNRVGRGDWRVDLQQFDQAGDFGFEDNAGVDRDRQNNRFTFTQFRANGGYDFGRAGELRADFGIYHGKKGVPGRLAFPTPNARQRDVRIEGGLSHRLEVVHGVELSGRLYGQEQERDFEDPTGAFPVNANHRNGMVAAELLSTIDVAGPGRAVVGLDWRRDGVRSTNDGRHHRITGGVYGLYEVALGPVTLVPSMRVDAQTALPTVASWKFAAVGRPAGNLSAHGSVGRAFRAPSFDDLFWPADAFAVGNPNLRPENATEWELGLEWQPWQQSSVGLTYYNRNSTNLILWQPGAGGVYMPQNIAAVRTQGVELTGQVPVPWVNGLSARAGYSYLKATTHSGTPAEIGKQLVGMPYHSGTAGLRYRRGQWLADVNLNAVGERYTTAANTQTLPSYALVDAGVRWRPDDRDEFRLQVRNLLNTSYRTVLDYPLPGIDLRFSASRSF